MYKYKIDEIIFKNGEKIAPKSLTIIVGPNNSGKSRVLREILGLSTKESIKKIILEDVAFQFPASWEELIESYNIKTHTDEFGNRIYELGLTHLAILFYIT
jgi:ABC-type Mn2+/Zn2+ transport system ATPase subunit